MTISEKLKNSMSAALENLEVSEVGFSLEHPAELSHGDYATNMALVCAKIVGKNPKAFADEVVGELKKMSIPEIAHLSVAGPGFINITLSKVFFEKDIPRIIFEAENFGKNDHLKGQKWVIEHTSPNPNKAMHLGHLRNNLTGMAIANIAEANGVQVIRDEIDNNRGIAIAKLMWGYLKFGRKDGDTTKAEVAYWSSHSNEWKTPEDAGMRPDRFVDQFYVLGADDFKNPDVESVVRGLVVSWEAQDKTVWELWSKVLEYSYAGQKRTLERLGNKWDNVWHEHEIYQEGKDLVEKGLQEGIFRISDGAVITNLESYGLPDTVVRKADGTSLYITQEIALDRMKKEKYHADKLFWVIGPEQSLWLKQVFAVNEQLGTGKVSDFVHLAYGYMSILKNGQIEKMSSREGNVIYIDDLIDMVKEKVEEKLSEKNDALAETIALGAVKFAILFTGRLTDTAFDIDRATNLEGDSGPYLQYTHARISSMIEKASKEGIAPQYDAKLEDVSELERVIYRFPEVVEKALNEYAPNQIATFLIETARAFNSFYGGKKIIDTENKDTSAHRLAIAEATRIVLRNGLGLLGITAPEKM